jgi:hypothetical protein
MGPKANDPCAADSPEREGGGPSRPEGTEGGQAEHAPKSSGICGTCSKREGCEKRKVEGGVWRCADYR